MDSLGPNSAWEIKMKKSNGSNKKPNKVKELYEQMQAKKGKAATPQYKSGKNNRSYNGDGKFNSQPRNVAKKNWHR
jgi:hypothetical protein